MVLHFQLSSNNYFQWPFNWIKSNKTLFSYSWTFLSLYFIINPERFAFKMFIGDLKAKFESIEVTNLLGPWVYVIRPIWPDMVVDGLTWNSSPSYPWLKSFVLLHPLEPSSNFNKGFWTACNNDTTYCCCCRCRQLTQPTQTDKTIGQ